MSTNTCADMPVSTAVIKASPLGEELSDAQCELLARDPELVYKIMRAIVRTVHRILRNMNFQQVELTNYIAKQNGRY